LFFGGARDGTYNSSTAGSRAAEKQKAETTIRRLPAARAIHKFY
jgi:hypothetical protein